MSVGVSETRLDLDIPGGIESARAKLVYLYLSAVGGASVDELAERLGMQKLALFSVLATLDADGYVDRDGDRYHPA